jgi:hypothetical protein
MINTPKPALGLALLLFLFTNTLRCQCLTPPPLDSCTGAEIQLTDNETLLSGVKKWYAGPTTTMNQLTMRGGTLVVCSNLTIDRFYMDSGTIVVRPGATFVIGGGIGHGILFHGNCRIYNYGTVQSLRNVSLEGTYATPALPNIFMNVTRSSLFKIHNQYFTMNNPNSFFVNNGRAEIYGLITDPATASGAVCFGNTSETRMNVLYNNARYPYQVPSGSACLNVLQYSQFRDSLTRSPTLNVCLGPSHYSDSSCRPWGCRPNAWGAANIFRACNACIDVQNLTLKITAFSVMQVAGENLLRWETNISVMQETAFITERSSDGLQFVAIDSILVQPAQKISYMSATDKFPLRGHSYYRVRCVQRISGYTSISQTVRVHSGDTESTIVYPNPFKKSITMNFKAGKKPIRLEFYNTHGALVYKQPVLFAEATTTQVNLPLNIPAGSYLLKIIYPAETEVKKIVKEE